jgi:deoxyadenosine/deoxycytidine kinase
MTIICLEGASGVGKSTTSSILEYEFGFEVIPEVNFLFKRSANESDTWYFEKQIERWKLAENIFLNGRVAVLDGDIMQPLWYNWIFDDLGFQAIDQVIEYYSKAIKNRIIKFPDKYFILKASVNELRTRILKLI